MDPTDPVEKVDRLLLGQTTHDLVSKSSDDGVAVSSSDTTKNEKTTEIIDIPSQKTPEATKATTTGSYKAYFRLFHYSTKLDILLRICGFIAACGAGAALPLMTIIFGKLVNNFNSYTLGSVSSGNLLSAVSKNALIFVYLFVGKFFCVYVHTTAFTITAVRAASAIRQSYIKSLLRCDIAYFDECSAGSVATQISSNADLIQNGLSEKLGVLFQGLAMLVSAYVVAFTRNWKLSLVVATTMPAVIIAVGITVMIDAKLEAKILEVYAKAGGLVEEALSSIKIITAFEAGDKIQKRYDEYLDQAKGYGMKKGPVLGVQYSSEFFVMYCAYALAFFVGIKFLYEGNGLNGGTIITVLFSVLIGTSSLTMVAPSIGEFTKAAAAATKVFEVIDRKPNIDPLSDEGLKPEPGPGSLQLRDLSFTYPARPTVKVLQGLSMDFEAGKTTAIVGPSGSGKSTIVGLIERWYDTESGSIAIDGINIKELNVTWLRHQIGYVQQEPLLFNTTVYENVVNGLYGTEMDGLPEDKKRELVRSACIEANADTFIQGLPQGYDTNVGERGALVSGGQKQRIAIARSIISNPRVLLLDEATSALDPKAEKLVQAALDRVSQSRTTIMIAHKLSTVQKADKIIVVSQGKVIEQGTHASLLAAQGAYATLVGAQNLHGHDNTGTAASLEDEAPDLSDDGKLLEKQITPLDATGKREEVDISRKLSLFQCLKVIFYEQRRLWPYFLSGAVASIAGGAVFPVQAFLFSRLITVFGLPRDQLQHAGNFWSLMFFILAIGVLFSYASIGLFLTIAGFLASRVYRSAYFGAMLIQDIEFFDFETAGAMTSRLSTDPQRLQELISLNIGLILIVVVGMLSSIILALAVAWKLALVAIFGCIPPLFLAGFMRMRLEMTSQDRARKPYQESARFVSEAVGAIRTVSSLGLESKILASYADRLHTSVRTSYKRTAYTNILFALSESLDLAANGLAFWYGSKLLSEGYYSAERFFLVLTAVLFAGQTAGFMLGFTLNTTKAHAAANQIIHLRDSRPPINTSTGITPPPISPTSSDSSIPAIEFSDVRFSYPTRPTAPVLRGLSLSIPAGHHAGIVGASGSGKTTIIALLERFYDIPSGIISISGTPLKSLSIHAHRARIGLVSQETTVYQGSMRSNVLMGLPPSIDPSTIPDSTLISACRSANIHDFITSLPEGYDTDAGSRGLALSGGQRQRLAIARALIRDPEILLFDEATSALDTESERLVQAAIERVGRGRTVVSVAHRLSTIKGCDVIFVVDKGVVVERGGHEELLGRRGVYWEMVRGQMLDRAV